MNLFAVGWNAGPEAQRRAATALRRMHGAYTLLDANTTGSWRSSRGYAVWMHGPPETLGPRRYVHATPRRLVLYDGTAVDPTGRCQGHDALSMDAHWELCGDTLEGRFVAVRIDADADSLDVVNDPFGLHPTFVLRAGGAWWLSNSVRLLAAIGRDATIDLVGMAECLAMGFPGDDRTLIEDISVLPAAQDWRWTSDEAPRYAKRALPTELATGPKRSFGAGDAADLAQQMGDALGALTASFAPLECPITAGRDSRMLTGLMMANGFAGDFFTSGEAASEDATIGAAIATRFGLPHRQTGDARHELATDWDTLSRRVIQQHDGLVTLMHAKNARRTHGRPGPMMVQLYGGAGELARGKRFTDRFALGRPGLTDAITRTRDVFDHAGTLLRPETHDVARRHIAATCTDLHEAGIAAVDIPDAFDLTQYTRRWGASQSRQVAEWKDVFLPFVTRPYVRAAFATPAHERLLERVPYQLLLHLAPALHGMPLAEPWPHQSVPMYLARRALALPGRVGRRGLSRLARRRTLAPGRQQERMFVLQARLQTWRERILSHGASRLWELVDRRRFDHLTSGRATQAELAGSLQQLYQVVTGFEYEFDLADWLQTRALRMAP